MKMFRPIRSCIMSSGVLHATSRSNIQGCTRPSFSQQSFRPASTTRTRTPFLTKVRNYAIQARHDSPIAFPLLVFATTASVIVLALACYDEYYYIAPQYAEYPVGVEQQLRLALHSTYVRPDADRALRHFQQALKFADESPMDPFGKPFIGLRIRFAQMLENFGHVGSAVEVLNLLAKDCEAKLAELDTPRDDAAESSRKYLLKNIIQFKVKASSLYETDYLQDMSRAKQVLSDAVGILVKESQDPQTQGFTEDNAAGLSFAEVAAILSQMGDLYAVSGEEANAVQVYMLTLQPLRASCNGSRSCKEAQVLSNIASTMDLAMKKPNAKINGRPVTKASLAAAQRATLKWADQALATANMVAAPDRDDICEMALLSARMTRADLLLEMGEKAKAKEELTGMIPVLREKGLTQLIPTAQASLERASA